MAVVQPTIPYHTQDPLISETGSQPESPALKIEDCDALFSESSQHSWESDNQDNPLLSASPPTINHLSQSPKCLNYFGNSGDQSELLAVSPPPSFTPSTSEDDLRMPSSPLLVAMRNAVDSLNKYEDFKILEKIGAGFFAEVYKVQHIPTEQEMVLKINKRMNGLKKLKEVELLKKLQHENILHYVGACVHEGQLHPLTEYMNGGALEQLIQSKSIELLWPLRLNLSLDIAKGMEYLHRNGMLHRDLNSKNVLLRKQGNNYTAVVADFGLAAKTPGVFKNMRRQQSIVGNPYWMAPEVLHGKPYNEKADVFSYGIILCEIISRLDADPDDLHRRKDFGMDEEYMKTLSEAKDCPAEFMDLSFQCCKILPIERPNFTEAKTRLLVIIDIYKASLEETIEPQPRNRLSYHETHTSDGRQRSRSFSPELEPQHDTKRKSKETIV